MGIQVALQGHLDTTDDTPQEIDYVCTNFLSAVN